MNRNRIFSSLLAALYILFGYKSGGAEAAFKTVIMAVLPLACIWFPDRLGGYIGPNWRGNITATSPAVIVCVLGWLMLLLPFIIWIV